MEKLELFNFFYYWKTLLEQIEFYNTPHWAHVRLTCGNVNRTKHKFEEKHSQDLVCYSTQNLQLLFPGGREMWLGIEAVIF